MYSLLDVLLAVGIYWAFHTHANAGDPLFDVIGNPAIINSSSTQRNATQRTISGVVHLLSCSACAISDSQSFSSCVTHTDCRLRENRCSARVRRAVLGRHGQPVCDVPARAGRQRILSFRGVYCSISGAAVGVAVCGCLVSRLQTVSLTVKPLNMRMRTS